ncbi:MAG: methyltransferase domain-containing protein [Candidatus Hydrothermarchaeaceae archaeon]
MDSVNQEELQTKVKEMYKQVAEDPHGEFHFEMGRGLAEKLGYSQDGLDKIPSEAIDSFAGVGYYFDLADIKEGESVLDLGSGSGMDSFLAALKVGANGKVVGIDMTDEQLEKARKLGEKFQNISFRQGYIEALPVEDESFDVVISNGVINLSAEKEKVFGEISRVLKRGGRMAISDIVTEQKLPEDVTCDASLWASCIGGAMQQDDCRAAIEKAGFQIDTIRENPKYQFLSDSAQGASMEWGVKSVSIVAVKK